MNQNLRNSVYSRNNLSKIKDGAYVINLDENESIGIHWIALYVIAENVTYFDRFGVEHIPKEIRKFIGNKNITTNICRIQSYNSVMCGYFSIGFIDFMLKGKSLLDYTHLFSPNEYKKNDKIIFLDSAKLKIVWIKITTFSKQHVSIILWSFSS